MTFKCETCNNESTFAKCEICFSNCKEIIIIPDSPPISSQAIEERTYGTKRILSESKLDVDAVSKHIRLECSHSKYPYGRLVMTGYSSDFKIQDLINNDLKKAFLSSFCIDEAWLNTILPENAKVVIACPKPDSIPSHLSRFNFSSTRQYIFPRTFQYGCMHIKLMVS
jgi:hypothetical protein